MYQVLNSNIRTKIIILSFLMILLFTMPVQAIVSPTSDFYINDYAGIVSEETENYIINTNKSLHSQTGSQIVVVTVQNLEGNSLENYATTLFRSFGIGDKSKNNGLLILLALEERQCRIEVGYGLEGVLPDGKTGRMQDEYMIPYFKNNNWDEGIKNGYNAFLQAIAEEYNVTIENSENPVQANSSGNIVLSIFIMIVVLLVNIIVIFKNRNGRGGGFYIRRTVVLQEEDMVVEIHLVGGGSFGGGGSSGRWTVLLVVDGSSRSF